MNNDRQLNYVNNLQNRDQKLYYVDDASELNSINLEENDKIYAINDNKLFQMEIVDQEEELSGSIVSFNGRNNTKIKSSVANIEPVQNLHGYENPWPAGGGKNKFYCDTDKSASLNGVTCSFDASTQEFTISGTNDSSSAYVLLQITPSGDIPRNTAISRAFINAPSGVYINFVYFDGSWQGVLNGGTIPDTIGKSNIRIQVGIYGTVTSITTTKFKCQIQEGSTAPTSWTPYSNLCPISGRTSATVTRTGKNLCPINTLDDVEWATENNDLLTFINGLANGTYNMAFKSTIKTLTDDTGYWVTGFVFTLPSEFINNQASTNAAHSVGSVQTRNVSFVINDNNRGKFTHAYIYGAGNNQVGKTGTATITEIQVELGSTATAYEPYQGNTYPIPLGTTVYGGTLDVTGGKMVVTHILFERNSSSMNNSEAYPGWRDAGVRSYGFITRSLNNIVGNVGKAAGINTSGLSNDILYLPKGSYAEKTQSEWIALAVDVQFVLPLPTPIEITLTPTQIATLLGTNNIWSSTGDITVKIAEKGITAFELEPHI